MFENPGPIHKEEQKADVQSDSQCEKLDFLGGGGERIEKRDIKAAPIAQWVKFLKLEGLSGSSGHSHL